MNRTSRRGLARIERSMRRAPANGAGKVVSYRIRHKCSSMVPRAQKFPTHILTIKNIRRLQKMKFCVAGCRPKVAVRERYVQAQVAA